MRKNLLIAMSAIAMLFATSCQNDLDVMGNVGDEALVSFTVTTPEIATRAYSDGTTATKLQYAVYQKNAEDKLVELDRLTELNGTINTSAEVKLQLTTGNEYTVIFWAAAPAAPYSVDFTTQTMTVNYTNAECNDETRDAFYGVHTFTVTGAQTETIKLKRPFAQLNIGTADYEASKDAGYVPTKSAVTVKKVYSSLNLATGAVDGLAEVAFAEAVINKGETFPVAGNEYLAMNYLLVDAEKEVVDVEFTYTDANNDSKTRTVGSVPVQRNYRTNIYGALLTSEVDITVTIEPAYEEDNKYGVEEGMVYSKVNNADEFTAALVDGVDIIILENDINLNDVVTRANADPSYTIKYGKTLEINLNGKKLSATSTGTGKNYNMFDVNGGTLTVKNGTMEYKHEGENMAWNNSTNLFNVTAGGVLNLNSVTAKNLGGSDMAFVAHLNNWGEVTLNVENSTLESNYVAVRVFNSGNDKNNVTIKNSTLKGGNYAFWVHNYTAEDFGSAAKAEAQKALLNLNIYNQGNTFSPDVNGIRYGFTNSVKSDAYGITKVVSEDGTVVTLGSVVEDGLIRRGVAGAEENTTITKVVVEEGVAVLYDRTFRRFYALETVELPSTLTTIGATGSGVFQSCTNLKNIVLPESLTVLGKGSFQECSSLESINIPAGVTRIESDALRATGLKEVEFHAGVTYFGTQAFRDCKQLTKVVINAPEFTMEGNTFGIMAAPFTPMTIEVANAEMKAYVESKLTAHAKTYITVVSPEVVDNTVALQAALAEGKNVTLANNLIISDTEMLTAPYGNKMAFSHKGGVFNGNGKTLSVTAGGDNYVVMTNGGTIKNLNIDRGFRGIVLMDPTQDVYVDNVKVGVDDEVCYTINTAEGDGAYSLYVSNSILKGWCSIGSAVKDVTFTNCVFDQGTYYTNVYGRLVKPYVNALFDGCKFGDKFYIDLSALGENQRVTLKNCTVKGVKLTAENWTSLVAPEATCANGQISIELKDGSYMTAENVADYVVIE